MFKFWQLYAPLWAPDDEGGSGGEGNDGGDQGGTDAADTGATGKDGDAAGSSASSILDLADQGGDAGKDGEGKEGEWKAPDGIPDHLKGKDANETLGKLMKAYQGARTELAKGGKGKAEDLPDSPDGYVFEPSGDDDKVAAELNSPESKPIVDKFRAAAHKAGIGAAQFTQLMREGLSGVAELGIPLGATDEEAQQISAQAEMEKLTELVGDQREAKTIVNTVATYGQKLFDNGAMTKAELTEFHVMVGTADSAALFYKILTSELGEKPIPMGHGPDGDVSPMDAQAAYSAALKMKDGPEKAAALEKATGMMSRAYGANNTGSVRSSVL